jgi:hypothetical protein
MSKSSAARVQVRAGCPLGRPYWSPASGVGSFCRPLSVASWSGSAEPSGGRASNHTTAMTRRIDTKVQW